MDEGLLSLKWNNHKSTFFHVLSILREKHTYTDVTLACDGRLYPVHKFILSTCSEYFSDIFTSNSGNNIVIVLKDVRRQDLEYLLDYMYLGQVDVAQSELSSLIKTAECLRIKGLAIPDDEPHAAPRRASEEKDHDASPPTKKKRHHGEDSRSSGASSNNISGRIPPMISIPPPSSLPQTPSHHPHVQFQRLQSPLSQSSQSSPTSQTSGKSHVLSLPLSRTSQIPTSPISTSSSHTAPLASPSHSSAIPTIKQEVTDPVESDYGHDTYEDTKPDVSDSHHLEQDLAVAGPSGFQGSADNWDGDADLVSYGGGEVYAESGLEESGDSEAQGESFRKPMNDISSKFQIPRHQPCGTGNFPQSQNMEESNEDDSLLTPPTNDIPFGISLPKLSSVSCNNITSRLSPAASTKVTSHHLDACGSSDKFAHDFLGSLQQFNEVDYSTSEGAVSLACPYCGKVSRCLSHLQTHLRVHTGERPFACQYCSFRTTQKIALKEHIYTHTGEKPHLCPYCHFRCAKKCNLNSHVKRHHSKECENTIQLD